MSFFIEDNNTVTLKITSKIYLSTYGNVWWLPRVVTAISQVRQLRKYRIQWVKHCQLLLCDLAELWLSQLQYQCNLWQFSSHNHHL
jgi:hypothetical protein